jgi:hypothetical protein
MAIGVGLARFGQRPKADALPTFEAYVPEVDLPVDDERFPYLRLIDRYDTTVFTAFQCDVMLSEFQRLAAEDPSSDNLAVLALIQRCAGDPSLAIWFVGD